MVAPHASVRLRRTWPQRLLIACNLFFVAAAITAALAIGYLNTSVTGIPRVRLGETLRSSQGAASGRPQNYLIVGVDSGAGLAPGDPVLNGRLNALNSDTIMVLRIDPKSTTAQLLSFPRDLWVDIAGTGRKNKINSAIGYSDPADPQAGQKRLIQTIEQDFQVPIDHYLQIDFAGFKKVVQVVGGVPVYFDTPVRDTKSGLYVADAGCTTLDENGALGYARSREYQRFVDGRWQADPSADLGRIGRQQDFIKRMLKRAIAKGVRNPAKLRSMLDAGVHNVTLDDRLTIGQLVDLGLRFREFNPANLKTSSLPAVRAFHGGADALDLLEDQAQPILQIFQGATPNQLAPSSVKVTVLNGSGARDQATQVTQALAAAGFQTGSPGDAPSAAQTVVRYAAGRQAAAQLVARYLAAPAQLVESADITGVQVSTGPDFTSVLTTPKPASAVPTSSPATTTTAPGAFTTPTTAPTTTVPGFLPPPPPANVNCG